MSAKARVLLVDASRESREILKTLLDRQGSEILETSRFAQANEIVQHQPPDLIVCDADADHSPRGEAARQFAERATRSDIPIVVLGTISRDFCHLYPASSIPKPYHYGALLRRIEEMLGSRG